MKNDPLTRVKYMLAERWGVSARSVEQKVSKRELQEWVVWFKNNPPIEDRFDVYMAEYRSANSKDGKSARKLMPEWGPKKPEKIAEQLKRGLTNGNK